MLQVSLLLTALVYLWLGSQTLLLGITLVTVVRFLVASGIAPLSDSVALSVTGSTRTGFGSVRVWGSLFSHLLPLPAAKIGSRPPALGYRLAQMFRS